MKLKFFITTFLILIVTVGATTILHFLYFRAERLRLIDRQIETTASILSTADFDQVSLDDFEDMDDYFHEVLGSQRAGKLFLLRDRDGKVVFRSRNAEWLPTAPPHEPKWQTIAVDNHPIRLLGIEIPKIGKTIQVGMILDQEIFHWQQLDRSFLAYTSAITVLVMVIAFLLSHILLKPLQNLASYLNHLSNSLDDASFVGPQSFGLPASRSGDEFSALTRAISRLAEQVRVNVSVFQSWTAQMAHELRTPLTIIRNALERLAQKSVTAEEREMLAISTEELGRVDALITNFLDWSSAENSTDASKDLHAVPLVHVAQSLAARLEKVDPGRINLDIQGAPTVFASPRYVEQALLNLLTNALKYSLPHSPISFVISSSGISVQNQGNGIPESVVKRLGEPFNFFKQDGALRGTGLGLAWVTTICKKYGWRLQISNDSLGPMVAIEGMY